MRITYIKLENVAGISVGMNKEVLEINFDRSVNKIVAIQAKNGTGKSVLLSSLTPFAYLTSLDERSTLPYITPKKNGYKEIHYQDGKDEYIIKHYFKATKETHSVKSYFMKNGEELNENGNVTSFNALVEMHFGLTQEMMRLIRIGSNVNSFISLAPARRKEYIGKLIEEIDLYLQIYKKVNDDIRVVKTLMQANSTNLYNCHITDAVVEEERLSRIMADVRKRESERDDIVTRIGNIENLIHSNDIDDLRHKCQEAEAALREFDKLHTMVESEGLQNATMDSLIQHRSELAEEKINVQAKINSLRLSIDYTHSNITRLETMIKKITSNNDVRSLVNTITNIRESIDRTPAVVKGFAPSGATSDEIQSVLNKLQSFNQISRMLISLGNRPISVYIKIKTENKSVDQWLKEQQKRALTRLSENDIKTLIDQVFSDYAIISPSCESEYQTCPYYHLTSVIDRMRTSMDDDNYSDEVLHSIEVISNNVDHILNELDLMYKIKMPDGLFTNLTEQKMLERLGKHLTFFDLSNIQSYLTLLREYELYKDSVQRLEQYEHQLAMYQKAGIDTYTEEIQHQKDSIAANNAEIESLNKRLIKLQKEFDDIESQIALVTKFNDAKKYHKLMESTLSSTKKVLEPLETAETERAELKFQLRQLDNAIALLREQHRELEAKLAEYHRLVDEGARLEKKNRDLSIIQEAVSTKKGIPVFYMKRYLARIQKLANDLLGLIYDDGFKFSMFNVTPETFEVPYIKNGKKIPDIKYASQSEIALGTMALSFALSKNASDKYNILLLDEIDAGLDEDNRSAFLKMLYMQMEALNAEQVFIISHNLTQMTNIPMDCIRLSEATQKLKLQNVIYEE